MNERYGVVKSNYLLMFLCICCLKHNHSHLYAVGVGSVLCIASFRFLYVLCWLIDGIRCRGSILFVTSLVLALHMRRLPVLLEWAIK